MDQSQIVELYREEVNKIREKRLEEFEISSIEQRASNQVHKWREKFGASSSIQIEKILNQLEKQKQSDVTRLTNQLRTELEEFKEKTRIRLERLDAFMSKLDLDDEIQIDYVKFELDTITKQINSLHMDIVVNVINTPKRRRSSTTLTPNTIELVKVFEFKTPSPTRTSTTDTNSSTKFFGSLRNFVRRTSGNNPNHHNTSLPEQQKHV